MNTRALSLFVDVVRRGSFAAAARANRLDPSIVSRTIANLEVEVGVSLFQRTTRRLGMTDAGQAFFDRIEPLVADLAQAIELAAGGAAKPQGRLRVLSPVSFGLLNLVPLLPEWLQKHPGVHVDLRLNDALLDLIEERIDVALRLGPLPASSLLGRKLVSMWARVCASPAYLKAHGKPRTPAALAKHRCLLLDQPGFSADRWHFRDRNGREDSVDVHGPVRSSNAVALKRLALDGLGIVLQGDWIVGKELQAGTLVDLFPQHEVTASTFDNAVWILQPPRPRVPLMVRAFVDHLLASFAVGPPWGAGLRSIRGA